MRFYRRRRPATPPLTCPTCGVIVEGVTGWATESYVVLDPCRHRAHPDIDGLQAPFRRRVEQATQAPGELR